MAFENWEMPEFGSSTDYGTPWKDTANDTFWGSSSQKSLPVGEEDWFDFSEGDWFVDSSSGSGGEESSWLGDAGGEVWDWLKSPQGTNVAAGAIKGLMGVWQQDLAGRMKGQQQDNGPSDAELRDARIKTHNASINKPMDMGLINFKRQ
jgi:hypothetical protein